MDKFGKHKVLFFWASYEMEYPFPSVIGLDIAKLLDMRKSIQQKAVWHGRVIDLDALLKLVELNKQTLFVFSIAYADDNECAYIELCDRIDPPSQQILL
jgi:hypothetical protein